MSEGHRHRTVKVKSPRLIRFLRGVTVWRSGDFEKVLDSRFVYGPDPKTGYYRMSLLGFLHGLIGLTLDVPEDVAETQRRPDDE